MSYSKRGGHIEQLQ